MTLFGKSKKHRHRSHSECSQPKRRQEQSTCPPIPTSSAPQSSQIQTQTYGQPTASSWVPGPSSYQPYEVTVSTTYRAPIYPPTQMLNGEPSCPRLAKLKAGAITVTNLLQGDVPEFIPYAHKFNEFSDAYYFPTWQSHDQNYSLYNQIASKLDVVLTLIDEERFSGDERELAIFPPPPPVQETARSIIPTGSKGKSHGKSKGGNGCPITTHFSSTNYFAKVNLYANSRLPSLPPMKIHLELSDFRLINLAAHYSERVYMKPKQSEKETHIEADFRMGTKAMVIKSVPLDDMATIVFAIRGSQTFLDWVVNLNTVPSSPINFLDDPGNLCHSGFLSVARKMIIPVATRLRALLDELHNGQQRYKKNYSLLITGHSAGGAIASLLYSHMLSTSPETASVLRELTPSFKRIHCITFGAPPVSLLPITKPSNEKLKNSLFLSFVNEGDPVTRADKKYVRSLLDLLSSPPPEQTCLQSAIGHKSKHPKIKPQNHSDPNISHYAKQSSTQQSPNNNNSLAIRPSPPIKSLSSPPPTLPPRPSPLPIWKVPESELSNAGEIVVLKSAANSKISNGNGNGKKKSSSKIDIMMDEDIVARRVTDEQLRGVVWGDPVCHMMKLYAWRVKILATNEILAINAVMGKG